MIKYYFSALTNFSFRGRARRSEYWWFLVFNGIVGRLLDFAGTEFGLSVRTPDEPVAISIPAIVYSLATLIQTIALTCRRLHDSGLTGWLYAPVFLMGLGGVLAFPPLLFVAAAGHLVIGLLPGKASENKYGPDPKAEPA